MRWVILSLVVFLSSCSLFKTKIEYVPVPTLIVCQDYTKPDSITPLVPEFVWVEYQGRKYIALTGQDYSKLAINTRKTINYIKSQNNVINYLIACIEDHNKKINSS